MFKNLSFGERIYLAVITIWAFINLVLLYMGKDGESHGLLWPFEKGSYSYDDSEDAYDFSEFLIYAVSPFILFIAWRIVKPGETVKTAQLP